MTDEEIAEDAAFNKLMFGMRYPYDASDEWLEQDGGEPIDKSHWSTNAARGVIADLRGRGGIKYGFDNVDEDVRLEIVEALAGIIRAAKDHFYD